MRRSHLLHLLWIPLALAVALGALYGLAYTPRGLAILTHQLNGHLGSGPGAVAIEIQGATGTLARGFHLDHLVIDHRRAHIELDNVSGHISVLPLAWQTIRVPELRAGHMLIHALHVPPDPHPQAPHFLPPLMRVLANRIIVDSWHLIATNDTEYDSRALNISGVIYPESIRIYTASLDYRAVHLRTSGELRAALSLGLTGDLHADAAPEGEPAWTVNGRFDGSLTHLGLDLRISEPFAAEFKGSADDLTNRWNWQGRADLRRLDLTVWRLSGNLGLISGPLELWGDRDGFRAQGQLTPQALKAGPMQTEFAGSFTAPTLAVTLFHLHHAASGANALASGTISWVPNGPVLNLTGEWNHFRWPLAAADARVHSDAGHYHLKGAHSYDLEADGDLHAGTLPPISIERLHGQLSADGLRADAAEVGIAGAHAQLTGQMHWGSSQNWQLRGRVQDLDVAALRPGVAGHLNFALSASGDRLDPQGDLEARLGDLSGSVRGQPAEGHGEIAHHGDEWLFRDVHVGLGATHIALDGRIGGAPAATTTTAAANVNLNFTVDAEDLALLHAGAHGKLEAHGSLRGDGSDLTFLTTAKLSAVQWEGVGLDSLDAIITFDPHGTGRNDARIELAGLTLGGRRLETLKLRTEGTTAHHTLTFDARAEGWDMVVRGAGRYASGQWLEQIEHAQITDGRKLQLELDAPAPVEVALDRLHFDSICMHDEPARLCASASFDHLLRKLSIHASNMPMRALTAGLTVATDYEGTLGVQIEATDSADTPWRGTLNAQLAQAAVRRHFASGRTETLSLGDGLVRAELTEHDLSAGLGLDAGSAGLIEGHLTAHGNDASWRGWPLTGDLSIETDAVGFLEAYVSQIDRASGRLKATLALSGSVDAPVIGGELDVTGGQLDAYQIALSLRDLNFHARLSGNTLDLDGSANCGPDGHAQVNGSVRWQQGLPWGNLSIKGTDLRVINIPEARVDASPDVALDLQGQRIDVKGQVALPYARIEPANLTNAVLPSSDEVIVGQSASPHPTVFKVYSDITLQLGERVTVNTAGLSGRLSGSIRVATDDSGISRGSGELKVEEGKYLAYGRNLDIQRGRLLFSNGLMGDPGLDLRAVKKFPDITAGINVRGTLRQPRMTFFSDPEVAQSQIVSLLLAGGSLESVQNTSTATDPTARSSASRADLMQGGAILAQQIGGRYNIEAGVEQDLDNETSLVLGRYLSPRLYVSYGVGLAEAINTLKMRYTIGDHWTVKTEAGTQRSADLVYTIER
jgi:translocation and assembly module TamB